MGALKDLWSSERGIVAIALLIATSVLCALGHITTDQWLVHTKWLFVTYVAGKTVTGATALWAGAPAEDPRPPLSEHVLSKLADALINHRQTDPAVSPTPPLAPVVPAVAAPPVTPITPRI